MKRGLVVLSAAGALAVVPLAYALLADEPVLTSGRNEIIPAADWDASNNQVLSWARSRRGHPFRYDAYVRVGTTAPIRLNATGQGYSGGIDAPWVIYQRVYRGRSDIKLYNLDTNGRSNPPAGVNTRKWEWHPTMSGDWILFGRADNATPTNRVMLHFFDGVTHEERQLARVIRASHAIAPGQVNGNWAVWTKCNPVCDVYKYDIANKTTLRLPKPATTRPRYQYGAAVTEDGVVYLGRSGPRCGANVRIVRYGATDPATGTVLAALPAGIDYSTGYARKNGDGSVSYFHDRARCASSTGRWDIYKVTDPPPVP